MKTKELITALIEMADTLRSVGDYKKAAIIRKAADRLGELSTGDLSGKAEEVKKLYTIHELARVYDICKDAYNELNSKYIQLQEDVERMRALI